MLSKSMTGTGGFYRRCFSGKNGGDPKSSRRGFTLVELLVVISVIALLLSIMMPALNQAKEIARALVCAAQMRVYGTAVNLYANDWDDYFPRYAVYSPPSDPGLGDRRRDLYWVNLLAPQIGGVTVSTDDRYADMLEKDQQNKIADFRKCPSGTKKQPAWIGVNYGGVGSPASNIPWVYRELNDPGFKMFDVRNPAGCISFLDTSQGWGMYSPVGWKFNLDLDGDGINDTYIGGFIYNYSAPRIHSDKFNTVMCDGHVEKLTFKEFLESGQLSGDDSMWRFR